MTKAQARAEMARLYLADETGVVEGLIARARPGAEERAATEVLARDLVSRVRAQRKRGGLDAFLHQYALSTEEGVVLMCLAEALLRVPDADTADRLIKDKIGSAHWDKHLGQSSSLFVNASTWALMLTGHVVKLGDGARDWTSIFGRVVQRSGEPIIRQAMNTAMRIMGGQFVLGRTIEEALKRGSEAAKRGFRFSFDMLGEAALTEEDAERYARSYAQAIASIAAHEDKRQGTVFKRNSISVKLSAIHPRLEYANRERVLKEILPRVLPLCRASRDASIGFTIDAEEADRLDLQLDIFEAVGATPDLKGWDGLGLAVQAYQKRAPAVIDWLGHLARAQGRRIPVRLVKGAYWDSEIKRAQEQGLDNYPVFTRKASTDVSYLACARALLADDVAFFPMFATHNAHSLAAVKTMAGNRIDYEFQRLHGMGEELYDEAVGPEKLGVQCRIYAPVGAHEDLLAYLVRRLLENGANTSFVNRLADDEAPIAAIVADPVEQVEAMNPKPHPRIPLPVNLFADRKNSHGVLLSDPAQAEPLVKAIAQAVENGLDARPIVGGVTQEGAGTSVFDPSRRSRQIGTVLSATPDMAARAAASAAAAQFGWDALGGGKRADILDRAADLFERDAALLIGLCVREAGKTIGNALADVREAVDFLRYYANLARADFSSAKVLPGPTGERNELSMHGRGVFAAISPWNFPVAIFTGQIAGALAAGNSVVAKPAEQTPLVAFAATRLLHEAGVPGDVLHLLPGDGPQIGGALVRDLRVAGVVFTGGTDTARVINRMLADRGGPIPPFIAETGGLNAMIADSTALPEQLVKDAVMSAFDSAGQRCSALRVLFLQNDIAPRVLKLLAGTMAELKIGDPMKLDTDIGPVIDAEALKTLEAHAQRMAREGRFIAEAPLSGETKDGFFFAPKAYEIDAISQLEREVFGPVLHVVRFEARALDKVCDAINATGYGLTLGVHTRIQETADFIRARARVGNLYVNRNQIGAVVGVQPFGGEGLSGTGPKAGGPHYLHRFAVERTACTNTTAAGGNASLLSLGESAPG
ncbi:MAG: bifunctional proline dehydrogenase/L-glutamate gamma-semialdehyde dehydrogenase PutA [Alphaproteobacteria bacterium]|nr:bifunctional proline dehydrogenase/L-glutamate gamma-semialdehyde dehydrogenase PutA [Alphaproteobacteria bacterium]